MRYLYNIVFWSLTLVEAIILMIINLIVFALTYFFDPKRKIIHKFSWYWGLHYLWFNPFWKFEYHCEANIDTKKSYVIVSNHQSMFDICVMYKIPLVFKWVSKKEVFKLPFVGWLLKLHGDILINRGDTPSTKKMLRQAEAWIKKGCSISIFPEGTRSPNGEMQDFKEGAFLIAKMNKLPVLPVIIEGTKDILPAGSGFFGRKAKCIIHVLPEITSETVASMKIRDLSDTIHKLMKDKQKELRIEN